MNIEHPTLNIECRTDLHYFHFAGTLLTLQCTGSMNAHTLIAQQQISDSQNKRFI